jgi:tetratricopeptide (TPR) repeat protein
MRIGRVPLGGGFVPERRSTSGSTYARAKARLEAAIAAEPGSAGLKLELGTLALVEGDFQTAEANLRAARELAPSEARIALRLADLLVETGRIEEGAEACREASALAGETPLGKEAALELALLERELELVHRPLAEARSLASTGRPSAAEANRLGCLELLAGGIEKAAEAFVRALGLAPDSPQAALNFGFVQGLASVEPAGLKRSARELISAAERFPAEPRLHLHLAELYEASSLYDASIKQIEKALDKDPSCIEAYDLAARYSLLGTGDEPPLEKKVNSTIERLERELASAPDDPERKKAFAIGLLGRARYRSGASTGEGAARPHEVAPDRGDADRAREILEGLGTGDEEVAIRLAECTEGAGDVAGAEGILRSSADESPGAYRPLFELAGLHLRTGRPDGAVELFARAVELASEEATVYQSLRYALSSSRRLRLAELAAGERLEVHPDDAEARVMLGRAYIDAMRLDAAVEVLTEATKLAPPNASAHAELGRALARLKRTGDAETSFRRAAEIDPDLPEAHRGLGNILLQQPGRMREGLKELELYRKLRSGSGK